MQHDVSTGADAEPSCCCNVFRVRIRDMVRLVEVAVGVPRVENVRAFRRATVALACLWDDRFAAESDPVRLKLLTLPKQNHLSLLFVDNHKVDRTRLRGNCRSRCRKQQGNDAEGLHSKRFYR